MMSNMYYSQVSNKDSAFEVLSSSSVCKINTVAEITRRFENKFLAAAITFVFNNLDKNYEYVQKKQVAICKSTRTFDNAGLRHEV